MVVHAFNNPRIQKAEAVGNLCWILVQPGIETLSQRNKKVNPSRTLSTIWRPLSLELDANFRKAKPVLIFSIADENRIWCIFVGCLVLRYFMYHVEQPSRTAKESKATTVRVTHLSQPVWWGWGRNTPTQVYIWLMPGRLLFCSGYTWINSCLLLWPFKTQNGSQVVVD